MATTNTLKITSAALVSGEAGILALANQVNEEGVKLDQKIQVLLASAVVHAHKCGDYITINNVISKLSAGLRTNAARDYVLAFAPVRWNEKKQVFVFDGTKQDTKILENEKALAPILETDWLSFRPEPKFRPVDTVAMLQSMIKKIESAIEEADERNKVDGDELQALKALTAQLTGSREAKKAAAAAEALAKEAEAETVVTEVAL